MSEQKYIYWCPGMGPLSSYDEGWEYYATSKRAYVPDTSPNIKQTLPRRKLVTDAEYRAHHGMMAWPCACPEGYRVIDFRLPEKDLLLLTDGGVAEGYSLDVYPILEKIEPEIEWVAPTDEDARHRPHVQVCDIYPSLQAGEGRGAVLYGVTTQGRFVTQTGTQWEHARMDIKQREAWQ